nr:MAG TPA: hypothetical protein [Caudoviricetes sp.]
MAYIRISRSFLQKTVMPLQIFQGKSAIQTLRNLYNTDIDLNLISRIMATVVDNNRHKGNRNVLPCHCSPSPMRY